MPSRSNPNSAAISRQLHAWYRSERRALPWRATSDPWAIWVSEIMLQQTRVDTVLRYWQRFLDAFPTPSALAMAEEDRLLKLWEGLGYYRRARNLQRAARVVVNEHGGKLPHTADEWLELPGIGRYTAAAIASIVHGEPVAVLDGNVKRVLARLALVEGEIEQPAVERQLWALAQAIIDAGAANDPVLPPGDLNQALMELGATVCTPRSPQCADCPLAEHCRALAEARQQELPHRKARKQIPVKYQRAAIVRSSSGALLIKRRPSEGLLGGLWEFPQVEVQDSSSGASSIATVIEELVGLRLKQGHVLATAKHSYSHFRLEVVASELILDPVQQKSLERLVKENASGQLALLDESTRSLYALHRAHLKLLEAMESRQRGLFGGP